jgi:hypothetical protein
MNESRSANSAAKSRTSGSGRARESLPSPTTRKRAKSPSDSVDLSTYQVTDNEWLNIGSFKKHVCCDCGLTHKIKYRIHEGVMQEQWARDEKETVRQRKTK